MLWKNTAYTTLSVVALMATGSAQERQENTDFKPDRWVDIKSIYDADVQLLPSAEDVREAAEDNKKADRPKGEIEDVLLDPATGEMRWAIVSVGGILGIGEKDVAVPFTNLNWNVEQECYHILATQDELEKLPEFDLDKAKTDGLERTMSIVAASWDLVTTENPRVKEASSPLRETDETVVYEDVTFYVVPTSFVSAKEMDDVDVYARHEEFGEIEHCIVDRDENRVAFVVLSRGEIVGLGGKEYIVPFNAMTLCSRKKANLNKTSDCLLTLDRTVEQLETGSAYDKPKKGVLTAETLRRVRATFPEIRG